MAVETPDAAAMQAMLAMSGSMPTGPSPGMGDAGMPGAPQLDPNMAQFYLQHMAQYFSQQASGLPGVPPMPFPGLPNLYAPSMAAPEAAVSVSVEGMKFQYQLTEDDLMKVFSRYGSVKTIRVDEAGSSAVITFMSFPDAQAAMSDLNGKVLNGLEGTLRINWLPSPNLPPPYPGMPFPSWGFPPGAPAPGASWPGVPPASSAAPAAAAARATTQASSAMEKSPPGNKSQRKYTCRFIIGIENDKDFQVARRIIGAKGANMKRIVRQTEAKLRLRGVGSGYFEGAGQKESSEPLQLCISCTSSDGYKTAVKNVEDLLHRVYDEYRQFCKESGKEVPNLEINFTENQLVYNSRSTFAGGASLFPEDDDGPDSPGKEKKKGGGKGVKKPEAANGTALAERGEPGPNAPTVEEIEKYIDERNEARRANNFPEADRIRQLLHARGVALMDEPGGRGRGTEVTTWRYWRD